MQEVFLFAYRFGKGLPVA